MESSVSKVTVLEDGTWSAALPAIIDISVEEIEGMSDSQRRGLYEEAMTAVVIEGVRADEPGVISQERVTYLVG